MISYRWRGCPVLMSMSKLMSECWHTSPSARLSAMRVKKSLQATVASMTSEVVKAGESSSNESLIKVQPASTC